MTTAETITRLDPDSPQARHLAALKQLGLPAEALPRHVAVIMDGNGRWALQRDQPRTQGHLAGAHVVRMLVEQSALLGIDVLTLYSFSIENWKRPRSEVEFLMGLCVQYLQSERDLMMENNVRFVQVGQRDGLPAEVLSHLDQTIEMTSSNTGLTLALALNYGSRAEITQACQKLAAQVAAGSLRPEDITPDLIDQHLYTAGLPDPDLLIRTAGEMRISNFLLWQISYAELWVTQTLFPDFSLNEYHQALREFAKRQRRFGDVNENTGKS